MRLTYTKGILEDGLGEAYLFITLRSPSCQFFVFVGTIIFLVNSYLFSSRTVI
jgi:hypothetical protein